MDREHQSSLIIDRLNAIDTSFIEVLSEIYSFALTGRAIYQDKALSEVQKTRENISQLDTLFQNSVETRNLSSHFGELVEEMLRQVKAIGAPQAGEDTRAFLSKISVLRKLLHKVRYDNDEARNMVAIYQTELEHLRTQEATSRAQSRTLSICGLLGNFALAIALVFSFIRQLSKRLLVLVDNASRLPKRQTLNEKVPGADELSYLDDSMHAASHELIQAWNHRDSLIGMVAHDLRSPLSSCEISLELMEESDGNSMTAAGSAQLKAVRSNIRRLLGLIKDLLTIDNLESGQLSLERSTFPVTEAAESARLALLSLAEARKITLENKCGAELIYGDRERILQILINYLSNAIKFSPKGSAIQIFCEQKPESITVSVKDQGCGLTELEGSRVFEKFFQAKTDQSVKGFGLGLAICKLIVDAHNGSVGVESRSGAGSRFWFSLPYDKTNSRTTSSG